MQIIATSTIEVKIILTKKELDNLRAAAQTLSNFPKMMNEEDVEASGVNPNEIVYTFVNLIGNIADELNEEE